MPHHALVVLIALASPANTERSPRPDSRYNLRSLQLAEATARLAAVEPKLSGWEPWASDQKLKVVFGVFTSPLPQYAAQMEAVAETWAQYVPPQRLLVVGVNGSVPGITYSPAPMCQDGHVTNPGISCKEATLLATGHKLDADWVVVVGSDNYVFPRKMEQVLASEDSNKAQILGVFGCGDGEYCEDKEGGLCGGAGYAISRAALTEMVGEARDAGEQFVQESMRTAETVCGYWSDQVTSCIARRHGVEQVGLQGLYGWRLGHEDDFSEDLYREKMVSSNPKALTFHYIRPTEMHRIHEMVKETALLGSSYDSAALIPGESGGEVAAGSIGDILWSVGHELGLTGGSVSLMESRGHSGPSYATQRASYIKAMNKVMAPANRSGSKFLQEASRRLVPVSAGAEGSPSD